jgi:hypothetical protein
MEETYRHFGIRNKTDSKGQIQYVSTYIKYLEYVNLYSAGRAGK